MTDYVTMLDIDKEKCYTYAEELRKVKDKLNETIVALNELEASTGDLVPKAYRSDLTPELVSNAACSNNEYVFSISEKPQGVYLMTYANLFIILPIYNAVLNTTYKVLGPSVYNGETGAVRKLIYNFRVTTTGSTYYIRVWSGETSQDANYPLVDGYTAYLFKSINLY